MFKMYYLLESQKRLRTLNIVKYERRTTGRFRLITITFFIYFTDCVISVPRPATRFNIIPFVVSLRLTNVQ